MDDDESAPLISPSTSKASHSLSYNSIESSGPPRAFDSFQAPPRLKEDDSLVGVFVVSFDTLHGNSLEFSYPEGLMLSGIEFKAIASGLHVVEEDTVLFQVGQLYGLSAFRNHHLASVAERGARMKSVGVLSPSFISLHSHLTFLEQEVIRQTESPGNYDGLKAYFEEQEVAVTAAKMKGHQGLSSSSPAISHPAGTLSQFFKYFGASVFVLWKAVVLRKRILFYSPPPIGVPCFRVFCTSLLSRHSMPPSFYVNESTPLFYVNVADIDELEHSEHYVACTTESIFADKTRLYDVYVNGQNPTIVANTQPGSSLVVLRVTPNDTQMYNTLVEDGRINDEAALRTFMVELNNRVLYGIATAPAESHGASSLPDLLGLDPLDAAFVRALLPVFGLQTGFTVTDPSSSCCC